MVALILCLTAAPIGAGGALAKSPATGGLPVRAAFLGDSYTFGVGATQPTDGYAYLVAKDEDWAARVVGLPGSGYVRVAIRDDKNIAAGLSGVIAAQPQVVIVECGHNDAMPNVNYTQTEAAAIKDLGALRTALPEATIVVVGPIWLNGYPGTKALYVRHAVHMAQQRIPGTLWIDPIAQHWFTGSWTKHSGDDATMINYAAGHPNNLGYEHIARRLEADLQTLGVH
ncbi:MAG TPA: SGNH/GDSL hydrolase family protein [Solirubrobacteraceae bacterium]|nr:SGNH/GDSL hydrolase family protein [Solirubrobacteraceae bacterium]